MAQPAHQIVASAATVSDKIRALNEAGYSRAEIAKLLDKRYQHVRNVLEADKIRAPAKRFDLPPREAAGMEETKAPLFVNSKGEGFFRLSLRSDGSLVLPSEVCAALKIGPGDVLVGRLEGRDFSLTDGETSMKRAQEFVRQMMPSGGGSLVDELIADRRREAAKAEANG
jgi:hypothetical protein